MSGLLDTNAAAAYLGLHPITVAKMRSERGGPKFVKLGTGKRAGVRYRLADLEAWADARVVESTSEQAVA